MRVLTLTALTIFVTTACTPAPAARANPIDQPLTLEEDQRIRSSWRTLVNAAGSNFPVTQRPGAYPVDHANVPIAVRSASASVFRVYGVSAWREVSLKTYADFIRAPDFASNSTQVQEIHRVLFKMCQLQGEPCASAFSTASGTAFLAGDSEGKTLWSNAHVLFPLVHALYELREINRDFERGTLGVPLFVFDGTGHMVAGPDQLKARVRVLSTSAHLGSYTAESVEGADYAAVHLDISLGKPLEIAPRTSVRRLQSIFKVGFPACTGGAVNKKDNFSRAPYPDSDGVQRVVNFGQLGSIGVPTIGNQSLLRNNRQLDLANLFMGSEDGVGGESGAPVLDADGRVLAIHYASAFTRLPQDARVITMISYAIRPSEWN